MRRFPICIWSVGLIILLARHWGAVVRSTVWKRTFGMVPPSHGSFHITIPWRDLQKFMLPEDVFPSKRKEHGEERGVSEEPTNPWFMGFTFPILVILGMSIPLGSSLCPQTCCSTCVDLLEGLGQRLTRGNATSPLESGNAEFWVYVAFALEQKSSSQLSWGFVSWLGTAGRMHLIAPKEWHVFLLQFWLFHCCEGQLWGRPSLSHCHRGMTVSPTQGKDRVVFQSFLNGGFFHVRTQQRVILRNRRWSTAPSTMLWCGVENPELSEGVLDEMAAGLEGREPRVHM